MNQSVITAQDDHFQITCDSSQDSFIFYGYNGKQLTMCGRIAPHDLPGIIEMIKSALKNEAGKNGKIADYVWWDNTPVIVNIKEIL